MFDIRGQKNGGAGWGIIVGPANKKQLSKPKKVKE
jgi:hypothetical protein